MPLQLPTPDAAALAKSPLALVVCQVAFEEVAAVTDTSIMLAVHTQLGGREGRYPQPQKNATHTVDVQVIGERVLPGMPQLQHGWRFSSEDGAWTILLMPDHVALQTTSYQTWEGDFRDRLSELLDAIATHVKPSLEQRLGLRYINRIVEPTVSAPSEWQGYIAGELLGPLLHPSLSPGITGCQQQIELNAGQDVQCLMRHGFIADPARDGAPTYLLDFDVFRQGLRPFDVDDIRSAADDFNLLALQLFQASVTPTLLETMRAANV